MTSKLPNRDIHSGQPPTPPSRDGRFWRKLALMLFLVCAFGCLTSFLVLNTPYWLTGVWTGLIAIAIFIHTINRVASSERKLIAFLQALKQNDFTITFAEHRNSHDYDLHSAFNQLNKVFNTLRSERQSQHQLLQVVVEQASAPLICFEEHDGSVYLMNNAAKLLFQIPFLQKIEALGRADNEVPSILKEIQVGEKRIHKLVYANKVTLVSIHASYILFEGRDLKVVTLQDVTSELAAKEADSWHRLLRVLTHEISNSAIPLSTLSSYVHEMIVASYRDGRDLTPEQRADLLNSLKTIDARSRSLKDFVYSFRLVGQVPEPRLESIGLKDLLHDATSLFAKEIEKENVELDVLIAHHEKVYADRSLTQQVFINLLKNAVEAMSELKSHKRIEIRTRKEGGKYLQVTIADCGAGITSEDMEQIFVPFFSTKSGGSGIGLSISRQIMLKQRGDISVQSVYGKGTCIFVSFVSSEK